VIVPHRVVSYSVMSLSKIDDPPDMDDRLPHTFIYEIDLLESNKERCIELTHYYFFILSYAMWNIVFNKMGNWKWH